MGGYSMSRGPDNIIREYLEDNATIPVDTVFNRSSQVVAEEILDALLERCRLGFVIAPERHTPPARTI